MNGPDAAPHGVDGSSPPPPDGEPVGTVAQEALKLLRAVTVQADDQPAEAQTVEHACTTAWCPVCQVVGFVRDNPDAIASVTRSATDLARSLRDLVEAALATEEKK